MYDQKLVEVIDHFQLTNIGLAVTPDFSIPKNGKWNDYHTEVKVITPDGNESIHKIHVGSWHFNIRDPEVSIDKRWRVILSFRSQIKNKSLLVAKFMHQNKTTQTLLVKKFNNV